MTIRHMRIFIEVARCKKMSLAAQRLYVSQPTVSQAIGEIESLYHVRLFERLSKKLYLTEEGEMLLGYARRVVALFDEMEQRLKDRQRAAKLRIGASVTVGSCMLGGLIYTLEQVFPYLDTEVMVDNTHIIEEKILESALDAGVVEGRIQSPEIICEPILEDCLVLICGPAHPLARTKSISMAALQKERFILREEGSGTRALFESAAREKGYKIQCKWVCNNAEAIKNAVMHNFGVSAISRRLVAEEVRQGKLHAVALEGCSLRRSFSLIYHKGKYITEPLQAFLKICRSGTWEEAPSGKSECPP